MRQFFLIALTTGLVTSSANASDLNVGTYVGNSSSVTVPPGFVVSYEVVGELNDDLNEGLASIVLDLSFDGGDLETAQAPMHPPMTHFAIPRGLNNINGFGGAVVAGDLVQVGGIQNTMKATSAMGPYPNGPTIVGVAWPGEPVVIAHGQFVAPTTPGTYTLWMQNVFANVIVEGETGDFFFATEPATVGTTSNLTVVVDANAVAIVSASPTTGTIDARQPWSPDGSEIYGWDTIELTIVGDPASLNPADFAIVHTAPFDPPTVVNVAPTGADTVSIELSAIIEVGEWTNLIHTASGTQVRVGFLPGDVDGSGLVSSADVLALIDHLNGESTLASYQTDINRDSTTDADDLARLIDLFNGDFTYPVYMGTTLP